MQRNIAIDILRVLFALIIVIYHVPYGSPNTTTLFPCGYLACEFFFMISGYFTARKAASRNEGGIEIEILGRVLKHIYIFYMLEYISLELAFWVYIGSVIVVSLGMTALDKHFFAPGKKS